MATKVDMSLDDIISKNKPSRGNRRGRGVRGAGARVAGRGSGRGGRSRGSGSGGFVQRGRGRSSSRGFRSRGQSNGSINGRWSHDMYYGGAASALRTVPGGPTKLNITNLDFGVSDSDIKELFSEFGNMKNASVHYDRTGRSLGTAHVLFDRRTDALKAIKQYNGVHLDGRPMKIEMDGPTGGSRGFTNGISPVKRLRGGPRPIGGGTGGRGGGRKFGGRGGAVRGRGTRGGGRRGGNRGGRGGGKTKVPTAEELDAELDAYVMEASK